MKKKTLVVACSAILGLVEGAPALADPEFYCENYYGLSCRGHGGVIAEMEDKIFDHLELSGKSILFGKNLHGFSTTVWIGSALHLVDSTIENEASVTAGSFLDMTRGAMRVGGYNQSGGIRIEDSKRNL